LKGTSGCLDRKRYESRITKVGLLALGNDLMLI